MKKTYIIVMIFLCLAAILLPTGVIAQISLKENKIIIESIVTDEEGKPIAGASVYGSEGAIRTKTDVAGRFSVSVPIQTYLLIEADGYESEIFGPGDYDSHIGFTLKQSILLYSQKDNVNVAFGKEKRGNLINAVSVLNPAEILKYDNIQTIAEILNGRIPGLLGSSNIRGIGSGMVIVDGLPRSAEFINLSEVEQITVLKDINSSVLYGSEAVNGIVMITTKRGQAHKKDINVSGYYGLSSPTALPKYLSSADFMELHNEARINDGLSPQHDANSIANYRSGNPYRYPSIDYYSGEYLSNIKPFSRITTELSGGNDIATYYSNLGWEQTGSLINFGENANAGTDRFNVRGNVDLKVNNWIKSAINASAVLINRKGAVGDYWADAATLKPNLFAPLIPIELIDPDNELLKGRKNDVNGIYLLGGTSSYLTNPIANGYSGGQTENVQRNFSFDNRILFNLEELVKGLTFQTNVSYDFYSIYNQSIRNQYSVYDPKWVAGANSIEGLSKFGTDIRTGSQNVSDLSFTRRFGFYGLFEYKRTFADVHQLSGSLIGFGNRYKVRGDFFGDKNVNMGLRLAYGFMNKYMADFSSAYVNSVKLPEGNRGAFSPSLGLAWLISSEDFMKSVSAVNFLKLRISGGITNSDHGIGGFYYYDNRYGGTGSYSWFEGSWSGSGTVSVHGGNKQLTFEKRKELNFGTEGIFFNNKLSVDANLFISEYYNQVTRPQTQYPSYYANFIPYENFNSNAYKGAELGFSLTQNLGDLKIVLGANALYATSKVLKRDEVYANDYQYRTGHPVDARFGLVADGFFMDQADINNHKIQAFGAVKPGDIKYIDQNNDGIIDSNDEVAIGRSQAPFSYGLNLKLSYSNFTLTASGYGRLGADGFITGDYYWVDGNDKYSTYILDRWTEATKTTATLPRLTTLSSTNNYRSSTFWLFKDNYFKLDRVQLTYTVSDKVAGNLKMKHLSFFVNGSNLQTISKYRDIKDLNVGAEPFYRSFSIGLKTML